MTLRRLLGSIYVANRLEASAVDDLAKAVKPLTFLEILGSVLAGAFGVQSNANRRRDFTRGNVKHFIAVGILFTVCFVGAVLAVVQWVLA